MAKYAYLCNGEGCDKHCSQLTAEEWAKHPCHHTTDERFAKNKIRRNRRFIMKHGKMVEVE